MALRKPPSPIGPVSPRRHVRAFRWAVLLPVVASLAAASPSLINGTDISTFFPTVGLPPPHNYCCDDAGVHYRYLSSQAGGTQDIAIGVFPSVEAAKEVYAKYPQGSLKAKGSPMKGLAHEAAWLKTETGDEYVILRRDNALVVIAWKGEKDPALELARKMDQVLSERTDICPRGEATEHPTVELVAPAIVAVGSSVPVKYRGLKAMLVRTEANAELHMWGTAQVEAREVGTKTFQFRFCSGKSVVFWVPLMMTIVPAGCMPTAETTQPWEWPSDTLYFVEAPDAKWEAAPLEKRETLTPAQPHLTPPKQADDWRQKALNDLAEIVQPQWLPLPSMVQVFENHARPDGGIVYNARLKTRGCNILYMGTLGRRLFAYIEQPDPLPAGQALLKPQDLLRPDVTDKITDAEGEEVYPRVSCLTRDLRRFRAFKAEGPFEPVNVLLLRAKFPGELNLKFPGYR